MDDIIAGFLKIQWDAFPAKAELLNQFAHHQHPKVLFVTCSTAASSLNA